MNDLPENLRRAMMRAPRDPMAAGDWLFAGALFGTGLIAAGAVAFAIVAWLL